MSESARMMRKEVWCPFVESCGDVSPTREDVVLMFSFSDGSVHYAHPEGRAGVDGLGPDEFVTWCGCRGERGDVLQSVWCSYAGFDEMFGEMDGRVLDEGVGSYELCDECVELLGGGGDGE